MSYSQVTDFSILQLLASTDLGSFGRDDVVFCSAGADLLTTIIEKLTKTGWG